MTTYTEFELENGTTLLIETKDVEPTGVVRAARGSRGDVILKATKSFGDAFDSINAQAAILRQKLDSLKADDVEVKFSLKVSGEAGNFAIGNVGAEAAYEVTLKWKNAINAPHPKEA